MTEIRNFKSCFGHCNWGPARRVGSPEDQYWNLRFNCNLVLGIWDFELFDVLNDFYDFYGFYDLPLTAYCLRLTV
jgi:hypothetical protein